MAKINELLNAIKDMDIVVPEFQREYVWSLDQSKELMVSLFHKYPTGSILVWSTNAPPEIKNNAVKREQMGWVDVLLDGQQRLTTLYLLLKGKIPPYYTEHDITHDPKHLYFNLRTTEFSYYQKQRMNDNLLWQKVTDCFVPDLIDAIDIADKYCQANAQEDYRSLTKELNSNLNKLRYIEEVDYYKQMVPQGVDIDKAIDIFDRVNSQGTKLTDAELVLTHIGGKWAHVRRVMKSKIEEYEKVGFSFELELLTRCLVVILTESALFEKMTPDLYAKIQEDTYRAAWTKLVKILDYLIPILKQSAYLSGSRDMNTVYVLVPLVAYLSKHDVAFPPDQKNKFLYWMFVALIWGRYSGQTDQRLDRDVYIATNSMSPIEELIGEIEDQRGRTEITHSDLEGRGAKHPLHRMLYIIAKYNKAIDWVNGGSLQDTLGDYYSIQSHHIFPQAFLYKNGYESENHIDKKKVNEIANLAFITRDTNFEISDMDPKAYLASISEKYPGALQQQLIPEDTALWEVDRYEEFLSVRRKKLAGAINEFLIKLKGTEIREEVTDYVDLIRKGENDYVEFKSSLRWDYVTQSQNRALEAVIAKTLAAFMNSEGGKLIIGISDGGEILGLENDYATVHNKNRDGFRLQIVQIINAYLGKEYNQYVSIKIEQVENKDVCVIDVTKSDMPVFVKADGKEDLYIRASASSQPMNVREASEYMRTHWQE